jgi:Transposase DDE domain
MPSATYDTTPSEQVQGKLPSDEWSTEVLPRLPQRLEQEARARKAFARARQISSASDLLRGILAYVSTLHSFAHLSLWSVLVGVADISANAWRKRLRQAGPWLTWLLQEVLASSSAVAPWLARSGLRRVLLIDGTHLACPGPHGLIWRVHTAFDLLTGRLSQLRVTDSHVAERLELFELQEGDLVITDRANGYRERLAFVRERLAHVVVRFSAATLPLHNAQGQRIDLLKWLKGRHAPGGRSCSLPVWIEQPEGKPMELRVVALRLTEAQRHRAQRRTKGKASKQQRQLQADTLYLAGWLLLVTTLPQQQWSDAAVLCLYRARWHIELLFKRIKQLLHQQRLRCTTAETARAAVTALLVGWALLEEEGQEMRWALDEAMQQVNEPHAPPSSETSQDQAPLSEWLLAELSLDLLAQQIRGHYDRARVRACLPQLQRLLRPGHRKRPHLYTQVCRWLRIPASSSEEGELIA